MDDLTATAPRPGPGGPERDGLQSRHSQALISLMESREDLHGVHALADFVADAVRWSA